MEKVFNENYEHVFTQIDEETFAVLYHDGYSKPNKPVNQLVSLEIIKEMLGLSDEELEHEYLFNFHRREHQTTLPNRSYRHSRPQLREEFEGVETRERMITDEDWRPKFSTTGQCILIHGDRRH